MMKIKQVIAKADMGFHSEYEMRYVVLGERKLYVYLQENQELEAELGGYAVEEMGKLDFSKMKKEQGIPYEKIEDLDIQVMSDGGLLIGKMVGGEEMALALMSNTSISKMKYLIKQFKRKKKNKEFVQFEKEEEVCCPKCNTRYPNQERKMCPKCMNKKSVFFRTLGYFQPFRGKLIVMMLCYVGTALLNLMWPYLNGTVLYDMVLGKIGRNKTSELVVFLGLVVLSMIFVKILMQLLGMIQGYFAARIVPAVVKNIKGEVFEKMGQLSVSFYSKRQTGGLMTRVLDDSERVTGFFIDGLPYFFINLLSIVLMCTVMFVMNWQLALVSIFLLPLLSYVSIKMLPRLWHRYGRRHRAARSMNSAVNDNLVGARVVKAFGQEDREVGRFQRYNNRVKRAELELVAYDNRFKALYTTVENISTFLVWGVGAYMVLGATDMKLGVLLTFVGYVIQLKDPLDFMSNIFRQWTESMNCAARIFEIVDSVPEIEDKKEAHALEKMNGEVELREVSFGYEPHKPILKNISFHVKAGEMLGIVGRSGAGKSTLVNMISRLYDVDEGGVFIDGVNVKDIRSDDLHRHIAMVSQEMYIFMGTVAENIAYAKPDASCEEILRAAKLASAHDFIMSMADGYDTVIGSSGRELSGGQRQRISIARAILADPKILILDEATAAVDTETEQAIQKSLNLLVKGRTTISIAHRLSTLKNANHLVVIDEGKVTEAGTHAQLLEKKGTYYRLMELQTKALALRGIE